MYSNTVLIEVLEGNTQEVINQVEVKNSVSDDFLCIGSQLMLSSRFSNGNGRPYCFLLPNGSMWDGFCWDRKNPWAPYCQSIGNYTDVSNDNFFATRTYAYTNKKHVLTYQWTKLPKDIYLKALGLTGMGYEEYNVSGWSYCGNAARSIFVPETLVVLPASILVKGKVGVQTPDTLQVSYALSVVGA